MNEASASRPLVSAHSYAVPYGEEFPMTLQIAMRARDGWMLASDRIEIQGPPREIRTSSHTQKITVDHKARLAYAVAGDELNRSVAADIAQAARTQPFNFDDAEGTQMRLIDIIAERWASDGKVELPWARRAALFISLDSKRFPLWW